MGHDAYPSTQRVGRRPRDVVLACLAIAIAVLGSAGYFGPVCAGGMMGDHDWLGIHFYDGRLRGFWIRSTDGPVTIEHQADRTRFSIRGTGRMSIAPPFALAPADLGSVPRQTWIRIANRRSVPSFGGRWRQEIRWYRPTAPPLPSPVRVSFFRIPFLIPVVLLLIIPVRASFGAARFRSRHRRNLCVRCGYDLRGTPSARCPECGMTAPMTCSFCGFELRASVSGVCAECGRACRIPTEAPAPSSTGGCRLAFRYRQGVARRPRARL